MSPHEELLDRLVGRIRAHDEVVAVWLDGSRARGDADAYSDVDLGVAVTDEGIGDFVRALADLISTSCDVALVKQAGRLLNVVTREWVRADIVVRTVSEVAGGIVGPVELLYDEIGVVRRVDDPKGPPRPVRVHELISEFLRFLGLLPVAVARREWVGAYIATGAMTSQVAELMQLHNGTQRVGGALRLSERLTEAQRQAISQLPPLRPDGDSVVAVQSTLAAVFLPLARQVAGSTGAAYPAAAEEAVLAHLRRHGIDLRLALP